MLYLSHHLKHTEIDLNHSNQQNQPNHLNQIPQEIHLRKKSQVMLTAYKLFNNSLIPIRELLNTGYKPYTLVATSAGDITETHHFYKSIFVEGPPRPSNFQNSLHNTVLGFLSICFDFIHDGATLSNDYYSAERALELAMFLSVQDPQQFYIILSVDFYDEIGRMALASLHHSFENIIDSASISLLTPHPMKSHSKSNKPSFCLKEIEYTSNWQGSHFKNKNPSDSISHWQDYLRGQNNDAPFALLKPDGQFAIYHTSIEKMPC